MPGHFRPRRKSEISDITKPTASSAQPAIAITGKQAQTTPMTTATSPMIPTTGTPVAGCGDGATGHDAAGYPPYAGYVVPAGDVVAAGAGIWPASVYGGTKGAGSASSGGVMGAAGTGASGARSEAVGSCTVGSDAVDSPPGAGLPVTTCSVHC